MKAHFSLRREWLLLAIIAAIALGVGARAPVFLTWRNGLDIANDSAMIFGSSAVWSPDDSQLVAALAASPSKELLTAIRATLANLLNPEASPHYPASAVVAALTEMQAAGRPYNASTLTAWLSRSQAAPVTTGGVLAKMRRAG